MENISEIAENPLLVDELIGQSSSELCREKEYVQIYRDLVSTADDLLVENYINKILQEKTPQEVVDSLYDEMPVVASVGLHGEGEFLHKQESHLKNTLFARRKVLDQFIITSPMLRLVHNAEGLTTKESDCSFKVKLSNELLQPKLSSAMTDEEGISGLWKKLELLKQEISQQVITNKQLFSFVVNLVDEVDQLKLQKKPKPSEESEDSDIATLQQRCAVLSQFITGIVSGLGVNWYQDEFLKELVLFCGEFDLL